MKKANKDYTLGEMEALREFLSWNVKEGYLDEDVVEDILSAGDWNEADRLREMGDAYANANDKN